MFLMEAHPCLSGIIIANTLDEAKATLRCSTAIDNGATILSELTTYPGIDQHYLSAQLRVCETLPVLNQARLLATGRPGRKRH
jgi:hypothetical protein